MTVWALAVRNKCVQFKNCPVIITLSLQTMSKCLKLIKIHLIVQKCKTSFTFSKAIHWARLGDSGPLALCSTPLL